MESATSQAGEPTESAEPAMRALGFRVAGLPLAIRADQVREVVALGSSGPASGLQLTQIPGVESPIRGVVMLRRQAVAVVDLAAFFDLRSQRVSEFRPRVLVVEHLGDAVGLLADDIVGLQAWHPQHTHGLEDLMPILRPYCELAHTLDGVVTGLIDTSTLLETIAIR